jgi:chromate transporter
MLAGLGGAATAVVAQAVLGMTKSLCNDRVTQTIAVGSAVLALMLRDGTWQWVPIAAGAAAGLLAYARALPPPLPEPDVTLPIRLPRAVPAVAAGAFVALIAAAALAGRQSTAGNFLATIVRAGSLVFGGGHVVLPLLQTLIPAGLVRASNFYAGYGATQAVPGPLFTFAAFLGTVNASPLHGPPGALVATLLIFLPSFLLVFALLPVLGALTARPAAAGALRGANAAVVGLLGALLYSPLIVTLSTSVWRIAIALGAFALVAVWKTPPWVAVACAAAVGALAAQTGSFA